MSHEFLHTPSAPRGNGLILTHGAGSNSQSPLLMSVAQTFADTGHTVLRYDLPFRQARPHGPPRPGDAERDREGLKLAVAEMRKRVSGRVFLGGHSYGGRQATMLCATEPTLVDGLLLFSYPLHPPRKPEQLRTQHFPKLLTTALFIHGTRDPFGSIEELRTALKLIPGKTDLLAVEGAGHDLGFKGTTTSESLATNILEEFESLFAAAKKL